MIRSNVWVGILVHTLAAKQAALGDTGSSKRPAAERHPVCGLDDAQVDNASSYKIGPFKGGYVRL